MHDYILLEIETAIVLEQFALSATGASIIENGPEIKRCFGILLRHENGFNPGAS
jgi:hypothetical protein